MTIREIESEEDAHRRLKLFFPDAYHEIYVDLLMLLCDKKRFAEGLEKVSAMIWRAYNDPEVRKAPNRYTRAIVKVANENFGFACQDNVVLTAPADSRAFGQRVRDRVLWKDSFAAGHGEFAHSYQWLVAGVQLHWGPATAKAYAYTAGKRSAIPLFMRDTGGIRLRFAQFWEYLVDCTLYQPQFYKTEAGTAIEAWIDRQLELWAAKDPTQPVTTWFVDAFLRGPTTKTRDPAVADFVKVGYRKKAQYDDIDKLRGVDPAALKRQVLENSDRVGFAAGMYELFPWRAALTEDSYRSANNVTSLSSSSPRLFTSIYDNHRNLQLLKKQNARMRERALEAITALGLGPSFFTKHDPQLKGMWDEMLTQLIDGGINVPVDSPKFHGALVKAARGAARTLGYGDVKAVENMVQRTLHPIQVRKGERRENYERKPTFQAAKDDPSIFHRGIDAADEVFKPVSEEKKWFHDFPGTINWNVYQTQLMK